MKVKIIIPVLIFLFTGIIAFAQEKKYIMHTIKQGETLSIIAKKYQTTVGDIMRLNKMNANSKLVYGSSIKIPADLVSVDTALAPLPPPPPEKQQTIIPKADGVVHIVKQGETLFSISRIYSMTVEALKEINSLGSNEIFVGQSLIVRNAIGHTPTAQNEVPDVADMHTENDNSKRKGKQRNRKKQTTSSNEKKQIRQKPVESLRTTPSGEGFFKSQYLQEQKRNEIKTGLAMTFKSESGWDDGHFYLLMNNVPKGTIVQLTAPNGKQVYAKVLMELGDMPANETLTFRITDAAAAALGIQIEPIELKAAY